MLPATAAMVDSVEEELDSGVTDFRLSPDHETLVYRSGLRVRAVPAGEKPNKDTEPGRASGWVDLDRIKISVRPQAEWRQMFLEAWRLQRENFWNAAMSDVDWNEVYQRYLPLVELIATRSELSDLMWELQGELGTSHAYEYGGAYRPAPGYAQGYLGVDWSVDGDSYRVARVIDGDVWSEKEGSPLARPGLDVRPGDEVVAINGIGVTRDRSPNALLANLGDQEVEVSVRRDGRGARALRVRTLTSESFRRGVRI